MKKKITVVVVVLLTVLLALVIKDWWPFISLYGIPFNEGEYFNSGELRIHYREEGQGTPLILVHGLGVNGEINFCLRGVTAMLAEDFRVIMPDLRGHGRSDKPHDPDAYGVAMCEDIIGLMDHLHIDKAQVLGYSLGGFVVLKLVSLYPERFVSYAPCGSGWTEKAGEDTAFATELAGDLEAGKGYGALSDYLTPLGGTVPKRKRLMMSLGLRAINDEKAIAAMLRAMHRLEVKEEVLKEMHLPGLTVIGERDPFRPFTDKMVATAPAMEVVVIADADHMSTLRNKHTQQVLQAFFKRHGKAFAEEKKEE